MFFAKEHHPTEQKLQQVEDLLDKLGLKICSEHPLKVNDGEHTWTLRELGASGGYCFDLPRQLEEEKLTRNI